MTHVYKRIKKTGQNPSYLAAALREEKKSKHYTAHDPSEVQTHHS